MEMCGFHGFEIKLNNMNIGRLIEQYDCNGLPTKRIDLLNKDRAMAFYVVIYPGQAFYYPKYD